MRRYAGWLALVVVLTLGGGYSGVRWLGSVQVGGGYGGGSGADIQDDGTILSTSTVQGTQLRSTVATGTPPLTVSSTTLVPNLYVGRAALADALSGGMSSSNLIVAGDTLTGDVTATLEADGATEVTVVNDSHAHTGATVSGLDVSDDTNLSATSGVVLTGDQLTHSTEAGYKHIPLSGTAGQALLSNGASGEAVWSGSTGSTYTPFPALQIGGGYEGLGYTNTNGDAHGLTVLPTGALYTNGDVTAKGLYLGNNGSAGSYMLLSEYNAPSDHYIRLFLDDVAANHDYHFSTNEDGFIPVAPSTGLLGQTLSSDADGTYSWATPSGSGVRAALLSRRYHAVVTVSTTVTAAVAGISDASVLKRYLVYVPDGTYPNEAVQMKDFVDIVGQSRTGVILSSSSTTDHTLNGNGAEAMLANLTVQHTLSMGDTHQYPIHNDAAGVAPYSSTFIIYNVTAQAFGDYVPPTPPSIYGAIGLGIFGGQRMYLVDVEATSEHMCGVLAHNWNTQSSPSFLALINVTATSTDAPGFQYSNLGSGQPDQVVVDGGRFSGTDDILTQDLGAPYAGAGECYINVSNVSDTVNAAVGHRIYGPPVIPLPTDSGSKNTVLQKDYITSSETLTLSASGTNKSIKLLPTGTGQVFVGGGTPTAIGTLEVRDTNSFCVVPNQSLYNEVPASVMIQSRGSGMTLQPNGLGTTGSKLVLAYWNGTFMSALEYANTASGTTTMDIVKSGGAVKVGGSLSTTKIVTFTGDDTTPTVAGANLFKVPASGWTAGQNITAFDDGTVGQSITVIGGDTDCVVTDGGGLALVGNWTSAANATLRLLCIATNTWVEIGRSAPG